MRIIAPFYISLRLTFSSLFKVAADEATFYCSPFKNSFAKIAISIDRINDGYCDCPADGGVDEPETDACSGATEGGWAGISSSFSSAPPFKCSQQPTLLVPRSHLNDGICDCCDGADEDDRTVCLDDCDELLAEERAMHATLRSNHLIGSQKRATELQEFQRFQKNTLVEVENLTSQKIPALEQKEMQLQEQIDRSKHSFISKRIKTANSILLDLPGTVDHIKELIVSICQLNGEMSDADETASKWRNSQTCIPLRLAGLDMGIFWKEEKVDDGTANAFVLGEGDEADENLLMYISSILIDNAAGDESWSVGFDDTASSSQKRTGRAALDEKHEIDDVEEESYQEYYGEDDEPLNQEDKSDAMAKRSSDVEKIMAEDKKSTQYPCPMSASRIPFYHHATKIMEKIDSIHRVLGKEEEDEATTADEDEETTADEDEDASSIDPIALQMVRGTLAKRIRHTERGYQFARSAVVLIKALEETEKEDMERFQRDLLRLATLAIYHSKLGVADIVEIVSLYGTLLEGENTCITAHAVYCPPQASKMVTMSGSFISFPGPELLRFLEDRCKQRHAENDDTCVKYENDKIDLKDIPLSVPEGYYNYYIAKPREQDDYFSSVFAALDGAHFAEETTIIAQLTIEKDHVGTELGELRSVLSELEEKIGGTSEPKFGHDGELYGLRDSCPTVKAGKYTYEVCIFGKAHQREGGDKRGTSLGSWEGMKIDESGNRVMKWQGGQKCWNGPKRSATVHVSCGAETRLMSADEPKTCEYHFSMESHIACDDTYRDRYNL